MRIISKFVDYYDFVANQYGGGDPSIVYNRNRMTPNTKNNHHEIVIEFDRNKLSAIPGYIHRWEVIKDYYFKWIVIAGKSYLLLHKVDYSKIPYKNSYTLLNSIDHQDIINRFSLYRRYPVGKQMDGTHFWNGVFHDNLVELTRIIGTPVFMINSVQYNPINRGTCVLLHISIDIPILGSIGFPSFISPQQMYQDISYFMGNTIKLSPDSAPPVEVCNKDKIVAHGFDIKKSFRHRH